MGEALAQRRRHGRVARAAERGGADALVLTNTLRGLAIDHRTLRPLLGGVTGGLSGPALKPVALAAVLACRAACDLPIVGVGGIASGWDALEFLAAGACAVQVGSAHSASRCSPAASGTN